MINYLELENFKSFTHVLLDLRQAHRAPKNMVFIYGENGAGKTHIINAFDFIKIVFQTMNFQHMSQELSDRLGELTYEERNTIPMDIIGAFVQNNFLTLQKLVEKNKQLNTTQPMRVKVGFYINKEVSGFYEMVFDVKGEVIEENLYAPIKKRKGYYFKVTKDSIQLSKSIFSPEFRDALEKKMKQYWGKHTLGALLLYEYMTKNKEYMAANVLGALKEILAEFNSISSLTRSVQGEQIELRGKIPLPGNLEKGKLLIEAKTMLQKWETSINAMFVGFYADLERVYYRFTEEGNSISYELIFRKQIAGRMIDIPVSMESTGTKKLVQLLPLFIAMVDGGIVCIDEIDTSVHDILMENILTRLSEDMTGQCIATTHNTHLMERLSPEDVYIIAIDEAGNREIRCISEYGQRIQKNNNLKKKYLSGAYDGVPYVGYVDFERVASELHEEVENTYGSDSGHAKE